MPRLLPSLNTPESRYSVPPNPALASKISLGSSLEYFCSVEQQAWSLTIQSILRSRTACHSASTSSRGRIGGLTLACTAHSQSVSSRRWPTVTSRRNWIWGNTCCMVQAASTALRELKCNKLIFRQLVSLAKYDAIQIANPSECGGRAAL